MINPRLFFLVGDCSLLLPVLLFCRNNRRNVNDRLMLDILIGIKTDRVMSSCGKNENPQEMNRRKFLKVFGGGAVASSAALYGCAPKNEPGRLWR